jgi:hypothetical protein
MSKILNKNIENLLKETLIAEELIQPALSEHEANKIILLVHEFISGSGCIRNYYRSITSSKEYRNREIEKKISLSKFHKEVLRCWEIFPKGFVKDVFKLYFYPIDDLYFNNDSDNKHIRYIMLALSNKTIAKIMTKGSFLKSAIFTRSIIVFYLVQFAKMNLFKKEEDRFMDAGLFAAEGSDLDLWEAQFKQMMDEPINKKLRALTFENAMQEAINADKVMNQESQDRAANCFGVGKTGPKKEDALSRFIGKLVQIDLANNKLSEWIEELLEKSKSYFRTDKKSEYEKFLDSDNPNLLQEFHHLHPKIRNLYLDDIMVKKDIPNNGINLYIDISGSMDAITLWEGEENKITSLDFAKALAVEMVGQKLIDQVYLFNHNIIEYESNTESLAKIVALGGTNISSVVNHIEENKKNALIITDAMDKCDKHSELVYFIGVKGASFRMFSKDVIKKYSNQGQIIMFDGKAIKNIGINGEIVNLKN